MGFQNFRMPTELSYGYTGGPGFFTDIAIVDSGHEERVGRWPTARWRWQATRNFADGAGIHELVEFYLNVKGALFAFRFKDWNDYYSNPNDGKKESTATPYLDQQTLKENGSAGVGDGTTTVFQLAKNYTFSGSSYSRVITHPVSGTTRVAVGGTEQVSPGWTYPWSVSTTTGKITFSVAPADTLVVAAGFQFDVPTRFGASIDEEFRAQLSSYDNNALLDIPLIEVLDEGDVPETWDPGGGVAQALTTDVSISLAHGRVWDLTPDATGHDVFLANPINYGSGGIYFVFLNDSALYPYDVRDVTGGLVATVPVKAAGVRGHAYILLVDNGDGTKTWISFA